MPRLLNKFRVKSIMNRKVFNYLGYALGEVLLIVLGILIAFKVDNINEDNIKDEQLKAGLIELIDDLNKEVEFLSLNITETQTNITFIKHVVNQETDSIDTRRIFYRLNQNIAVVDRSQSYFDLKEKGLISRIDNDSITKNLREHYGYKCDLLTEWADYHKKSVLTSVEPKLLELCTLKDRYYTDSESSIELIKSGKLNNVANHQLGLMIFSFSYLNEQLNSANTLIDQINTLLSEKK